MSTVEALLSIDSLTCFCNSQDTNSIIVIQETVKQSVPDLACLKLACPVSTMTLHCRRRTTLLLLPTIKTTQAQISGDTLAHALQTRLVNGSAYQGSDHGSRPDLLCCLGVINNIVSIGVQLTGVNAISHNGTSAMLPQVMSPTVQVCRFNGQDVAGIQVSSHLQQHDCVRHRM